MPRSFFLVTTNIPQITEEPESEIEAFATPKEEIEVEPVVEEVGEVSRWDVEPEEDEEGEEEEVVVSPPPRPVSMTRPIMSPPPARVPPEFREDDEELVHAAPHPVVSPAPVPPPPSGARRSIPPPPMRIVDSDEEEEQSAATHDEGAAPMVRIIPATPGVIPPTPAPPRVGGGSGEARRRPGSPEPRFRLPDIPGSDQDEEDEEEREEEEEEEEAKTVPAPVPIPSPASRPRRESLSIPDVGIENVNDNVGVLKSREVEEEEEVLPTPPRRGDEEDEGEPLIVPPRGDKEILDEDEGDPIDPSFHIPSRQTSSANLRESAEKDKLEEHVPVSVPVPVEEDEEQVRRRTIAERMARLGGIRFGAPPPIAPVHRPSPQEEEGEVKGEAGGGPEEEEDEERARKERIAKKLAGMGGMRLGMVPMMPTKPAKQVEDHDTGEESAPRQVEETGEESFIHPPRPSGPRRAIPPPHRAVPPPQVEEDQETSEESSIPPRPSGPHRAIPPPPPPAAPETDEEYESMTNTSIEEAESEMEEIRHEEVEGQDEAPPPPIPSRQGRRASVPVPQTHPSPPPRPPVPTILPTRKPSSASQTSTARKSSTDSTSTAASPTITRKQSAKAQSDYVMVEEPVEDIPSRATHPPPPRSIPPPPASPPLPPEMTSSSQWELPSIPRGSLDLGAVTDLSNSWSEDLVSSVTSAPPPLPSKTLAKQANVDYDSLNITPDDLTAVWGRVGVQVCESATALYEKSKKALIGDGTYHGFIQAVIDQVPIAAPVSTSSYGYLVYAQTGGVVQKRVSDIMPGDVVLLHDAKFKGHKGIQTYSQSVGAGEPLVGVIGEFEAKKFKIRVFQANQHVGQQVCIVLF